MAQLSHPYLTTGKTIALTIWIFAGKIYKTMDFPVGTSGKEPICQCRREKRRRVAKSHTQLKQLSQQTYKTMDFKNIYMVLKTRMRAPKYHLSFSKEKKNALINAPTTTKK